jgi:hypothetical protein
MFKDLQRLSLLLAVLALACVSPANAKKGDKSETSVETTTNAPPILWGILPTFHPVICSMARAAKNTNRVARSPSPTKIWTGPARNSPCVIRMG